MAQKHTQLETKDLSTKTIQELQTLLAEQRSTIGKHAVSFANLSSAEKTISKKNVARILTLLRARQT